METLLQWSNTFLGPVVGVACFALGYIAYFFFSQSSLPDKLARRLGGAGGEPGQSEGGQRTDLGRPGLRHPAVAAVLLKRLAGVLCLGVFPAVIVLGVLPGGLTDYGLGVVGSPYSFAWIAAVAVAVIPLTAIFSRGPAFTKMYPQIRVPGWTAGLFLTNCLSWAAYLLAYEFCFRGFLLFSSVEALGVWPAVAVNVALYACVHMPKGLWETLGALPLGLAFCVASLHVGTIWVAFFGHLILALSNDVFALLAGKGGNR